MVVFRNLCKNQVHFGLFSKTKSNSFVLKELIVSLEVLTTAIHLQNKVEPRLYFDLKTISFVVDLPQNISNELVGACNQRFKKRNRFEIYAELSDVDNSLNLGLAVKSLAESRLENVTGVWSTFIL